MPVRRMRRRSNTARVGSRAVAFALALGIALPLGLACTSDSAHWPRGWACCKFIPGTWRRWASDGNGDGKTDPQNLYDASVGAARKLCADAGPAGMHTDDQIARALKPYAVTASLVKAKLARARQYEAQGLPAPDPAVAGAITPR